MLRCRRAAGTGRSRPISVRPRSANPVVCWNLESASRALRRSLRDFSHARCVSTCRRVAHSINPRISLFIMAMIIAVARSRNRRINPETCPDFSGFTTIQTSACKKIHLPASKYRAVFVKCHCGKIFSGIFEHGLDLNGMHATLQIVSDLKKQGAIFRRLSRNNFSVSQS